MKIFVTLFLALTPLLSFAQETAAPVVAAAQGAPAQPGIESLLVQLGIIFVIFYFLLIRPQQKKHKAHQLMVSALKKGDKVITGAGFVGTVTKANEGDRFVNVEIANGVEVQVLRSTINEFSDKPQNEVKK